MNNCYHKVELSKINKPTIIGILGSLVSWIFDGSYYLDIILNNGIFECLVVLWVYPIVLWVYPMTSYLYSCTCLVAHIFGLCVT